MSDVPKIVQFPDSEKAEKQEIATEAGHWYLPDGTPFYTIARRSGTKKGELRPVSLRHDRATMLELGVVPSSTGITRMLASPALGAYIEKQIYLATLDLYDVIKSSSLDEKAAMHLVRLKAREHRDKAAERGTSLHSAIEAMLRGDDVGDRWRTHCDTIWDTLEQYGIDLTQGESERSFAHPMGYGGKCDYHELATQPEPELGEDNGLVIDFKSKDTIERGAKLAYDEHVMQIASYAQGLLIPNARGVNVFVGELDGNVDIREWTPSELGRGWELFQLLLRAWQIKNNYYPKAKLK